jgi:hypothetical protein
MMPGITVSPADRALRGRGPDLASPAWTSASLVPSGATSPPRGRQPFGGRRSLRRCAPSDGRALAGLVLLLAPWVALTSAPARAHEVPGDVTVQLLVRVEGDTLRVLARAPLEAMQEMRIPTTGPELLDLAAARRSGVLADAASLWLGDNLELWADGTRLPAPALGAVRVSLPSDRSFASWESALAHTLGAPLPETIRIPWRQALLDASFEVPLPATGAGIAVRPRFERLGLRVRTALRFVTAGGAVRVFELHGDPGLVRLDPRWHQAAGRFVELGFFHILGGVDHLLFLACLILPLRRLRQLVLVVTSFTVAHSVTLIAAALGLAPKALWFPPLVELLIAASIVWMAFENILGLGAGRRWAITFGFGLVHGFGFSFALGETLQLAGSHLVTSLLAFNLGVELGQVFVLVIAVPALDLLLRGRSERRWEIDERWGTILLSALIAHTAWHWLAERTAAFAQYRVGWPLLAALPASALPWLALMVVVAVPAWRAVRRRRRSAGPQAVDGSRAPAHAVVERPAGLPGQTG